MLPGCVPGVVRTKLTARNSQIHAANTERNKTLSIWLGEPGNPLALLNQKRFSSGRSIWRCRPSSHKREGHAARGRKPDHWFAKGHHFGSHKHHSKKR